MDEYKSRLSTYLSDMIREELEKYDGGFTDEWNDQRKKNAEVLGYKLAGTSDISEGVKDPKLKVGQKIRYKKDSRRLYTLKKITHGNRGIPEDPAGTSYMFVAPGNRKEYHTKKTWAQAIKKGWLSLESVNEEITDWQGGYNDEFKFKKGQLIRDINPDCPHHGSEGEITKVTKDEVTYTVRNNGKTYKVGDELTKTKDQLTPLSINESKIKYYKTISKKEWSKTPKSYKSVIDGVKFKMFLDRQKGTILAPVKVESVNESGILYKAGVKKYGKDGMAKILSAAGKKKSHAEIGAIKDKYEKESLELDEGGMGILDKDQTDVLHAIVMKNKNKNSKSILSITMKDRMFKGVDKKELLGYIEGAKEFVRYMGRTGNESINEKMGPEQFHKHMQYVFDTQFKTPEEKKMKKSIIKKINKAQKKKGLPLFKEERDYKAEYQARKSNYYEKYQSSTKAKKYRAELNQYNRKRGTYGNGDGMDASHKGGKIVGFEKESTNRSRREKSRLKKENIREDIGIETFLGGILKGMKKAGLKLKSAQVMKHGWSKSKDKIGFFIKVEKREIEGKKLWTLQLEVDRDGYLWYLSAPKDIKIGKWADTSQLVRGFKKLDRLPGFGQDAIFKRRK